MSNFGGRLSQRYLQALLQVNAQLRHLPKNGMATRVLEIAHDDALLKAYQELGLKTDCSKQELKEKFVQLAKTYHPDTGKENADSDKFMKVKNAYKTIAAADYSKQDQSELNAVQEQFHDISYTAPQHRQYLEYGGIGYGTPFERMKQHQQHRMQQATEHARDFAINKIAKGQEQENEASMAMGKQLVVSKEQAYFSKKQKTTNTIERMVEDLIQQSMSRGDFSKLAGMGEPLKDDNFNPYVDEMQHKLNKILINNGFSPPWILKEREIRDDVRTLRAEIGSIRKELPENIEEWSAKDVDRWERAENQLRYDITQVNKAIQDFNLIAPGLSRQMCHLIFDRELERAERVFDLPPKAAEDEDGSHQERVTTATGDGSGLKSGNPEFNTGGFRSLLAAMSIRKEENSGRQKLNQSQVKFSNEDANNGS